MEIEEDGYFHLSEADLMETEKWLDSCLVMYSVTYCYNGGISIDGRWGYGIKVPPPNVPEGYRLVDIGVGLQFGFTPPKATSYLKPI